MLETPPLTDEIETLNMALVLIILKLLQVISKCSFLKTKSVKVAIFSSSDLEEQKK